MILVRTLLGIDLLVALVVVYFFVIDLADGHFGRHYDVTL